MLAPTDFRLKRLKTAPAVSVKFNVMVSALGDSFDTNIEFITDEGVQVFPKLFELVKSKDEINPNLLPLDNNLLQKINKFASVKHISKNIQRDENKLKEIFLEMKKDLKNLFLDRQISELESKFSSDMDQSTLNEIIELKKLQNNN